MRRSVPAGHRQGISGSAGIEGTVPAETASGRCDSEATDASRSDLDETTPGQHNGNHRKGARVWTDAQLRAAIAAIESGAQISAVARHCGIPRSSRSDHVDGRRTGRKRRPQPVLNTEEGQALESYILSMADLGYPLTTDQLRLKVALLPQERPTPFANGIPGRGWLRWFKSRHLGLTIGHSQSLEISRAKGLNAQKVQGFYKNLHKLYQKHGYPPQNIWNCDGSGAHAGRTEGDRVWSRKESDLCTI